MSIVVAWDNPEHTVLRFVYQGQWTWSEFHESLTQGWSLAADVAYPVDHIYDVTNRDTMPAGALSQMRSLRNKTPVKIGRRVLVGASMLVMAISQAMLKLNPEFNKKFLFTSTLDEARRLLYSAEADTSENPL